MSGLLVLAILAGAEIAAGFADRAIPPAAWRWLDTRVSKLLQTGDDHGRSGRALAFTGRANHRHDKAG